MARGPATAGCHWSTRSCGGSGNANRTQRKFNYDKIIHTLGIRAGRCRRTAAIILIAFLVFPKAQATARGYDQGRAGRRELTSIHCAASYAPCRLTISATSMPIVRFIRLSLETIRAGLEMARRKAPARRRRGRPVNRDAHQKRWPCIQSSPKHDQCFRHAMAAANRQSQQHYYQ